MSIETLTSAHSEEVEKPESQVLSRIEGKLTVTSIDGFSATPRIESFMQRSGETALHGNFDRGLTAFDAPDKKLFYRKSPDYSLRNAHRAEAALAKQMGDVPTATALAFSREDVTFYQPHDSKRTLVAMTQNEHGMPTAHILQSNTETSIGHYEPNGGDRLYLLPGADDDAAVIEYLQKYPGSEEDIINVLQGERGAYAVLTISETQAESMARARAQAATRKGSVDRRRIEDQRAARSTGAKGATTATSATEEALSTTASEETQPQVDEGEPVATNAPSALSASDEKSASSTALDRLRQVHDENATAPAAVRFDKSADYQDALQRYDAADTKLAKGMAMRTKLGAFARRKTRERLDTENAATTQAYFAQAELFETLQVEKWKANKPDITDEEITVKLAAYHTAKQRLHAMRTQQEFSDLKRFGKVSEWHDTVLEKYAGLSKKQKIAASLGAAAVIGGVGLIAGAAGVVGAAGMVGAKMYKTYAQNRAGLYAPTQRVETLAAHTQGDAVPKTDETLRREARQAMERRQRTRTAEVDKINKRTKIAMIGSAALIGGGVVSHFGAFREVADHVGGWWNSTFPPDNTDVITAPADAHVEFPRTEIKVVPGVDHAEVPAPATPEFSADALRVDVGEGWYQTFNEIGITNATEQANLLQKVGPELVRRGVAYQMADGSYGMSRPGALNKDVLELIQKSR